MYFAIDGLPLRYQPVSIDIMPPEPSIENLADGNPAITESQAGVTLLAKFGSGAVAQEAMVELLDRRANIGMHMLEFEDRRCNALASIVAYMPPVSRIGLPYTVGGALSYGETSIEFQQINPAMDLGHMVFKVIPTLSAGNGAFKLYPMASGKPAYITGWLKTMGSGNTRIQIANDTQSFDYLTSPGDFIPGSGTGLMENDVLDTTKTFMKTDVLRLDVDNTPGDASGLYVTLWYYHFRP